MLGLIVFLLANVQAQYTVSGTIVDSLNSKEKIFYANVGIVRQDSIASLIGISFSDNTGKFTIEDVPAGNFNLKVSLVGYEMLTTPIIIEGNDNHVDLGKIPLKKLSTNLGEVHIVGEKPVYLVEGEVTSYNVSEDPAIQTGTAADALQNAPGVEVDVEGNITLRGSSSVEIWINDKPSDLNEDNLKNFIQQLPANSLERIEVINNPSAKYGTDADAIINIVMQGNIKKNSFLSFGVNGSSKPEVAPWISYVWANQKLSLSFYLNGRYSFRKSISETYATRISDEDINEDGSLDTASYNHDISESRNNNYSGGFYFSGTYTFDTANNIRFNANVYPSWSNALSQNNDFRIEYLDDPDTYVYTTDNNNHGNNFGVSAGIFYEHKFNSQGHRITANVNGGYSMGGSYSDYLRDYLLQNSMDFSKLGTNRSKSYNVRAALDYSYPYSKNGEIAVGVDGSYRNGYALVQYDTLVANTQDLYNLDSLRLKETWNPTEGAGAYFTIQHKFGNFTIKGGLRARYSHEFYQILNSPKDNVIQNNFNLLPSLHLSYRTKSMHNFRLSYTRRVSNPSAQRLSTFVTYSEDAFSMGNPDLLPSHTNNIEFAWTKFFNKFGNVGISAYFKNTNNQMNTLTDVMFDEYFGRIVTYTMPLSEGSTWRTGADLNVTYRLKAFMNIRFYANIYYNESKFLFRENQTREVSNLGYSFRLNFWAKVWKMLEIYASANYRSKNVALFTTTQPRYSIDCGLRADFLDRKISAFINVTDIFNWNKTASRENNPYYISTSTTKYNSRFISAGITFRFGKMELESKSSGNGESTEDTNE